MSGRRYTEEFFRKAVVPYALALCEHEKIDATEVRYQSDIDAWEHVRQGVRHSTRLVATVEKDGTITPGPAWPADWPRA